MTSRDEDIAWFIELLGSLGRVTARRMFGGSGLYADGRIVALEVEGTLYLKTDTQTRARFAEGGGRPFVYDGKGKAITVGYWTPPDEAMDAPDAMRPWARLALEASARSGAAKPQSKKRPARKKAAKTSATKTSVAKKASRRRTGADPA
ncbi:MAG: TfoX/Sxy family protein [Lysobacter sp.]|nr:TfoX/Sxy family protein [Lysobacter sp.]